MTILIVEDEATLLEMIERRLRREGYTTFTATSAEEGMTLFRKVRPHLVILDVMLPKRSGFDLCEAIRREHSTPIIFMSARGAEADRVRGLEIGGDDYVVKPVQLGELAARVKAVLRRTGAQSNLPTGPVVSGNLMLNVETHTATLEGKPFEISPKAFALLAFLMAHPGQAFTREVLLDRVWGSNVEVTERTVDVHARWIRQAIEVEPHTPKRLVTVRGIGYRWVA